MLTSSVVSEMVSFGKSKRRMLGHIGGESKIFFLKNYYEMIVKNSPEMLF